MKDKNELIILAGDVNEILGSESSNMTNICQDLALVDVMETRHPHLPEPVTYIRGSTRIDYFLILADLMPSVRACGYNPFHCRLKSDHYSMFLDLHTTTLFGSLPPHSLQRPFLEYDLYHCNNFFTNLENLSEDPVPNPEAAE
jgi:hypothetical protein